jgi:hypothetical protein
MSMVLKVPGRRADHEIDIFFKGNVHYEAKFALNWRLFEMEILSFSQNPLGCHEYCLRVNVAQKLLWGQFDLWNFRVEIYIS